LHQRALMIALGMAALLSATFASIGFSRQVHAQSPYYGAPYTYPFPYYPVVPSGSISLNSSAPITTSNTLGSTTFIPAPPGLVAAYLQATVPTGGYCAVGDGQVFVPTGASPANYGCTGSPFDNSSNQSGGDTSSSSLGAAATPTGESQPSSSAATPSSSSSQPSTNSSPVGTASPQPSSSHTPTATAPAATPPPASASAPASTGTPHAGGPIPTTTH
jgi:hypothetical protein